MTYQLDGEWELRAKTSKAILIVEPGIEEAEEEDGLNRFWVPRSVLKGMDMADIGDVGTVEVDDWWAKKNGFDD